MLCEIQMLIGLFFNAVKILHRKSWKFNNISEMVMQSLKKTLSPPPFFKTLFLISFT